MPIRLMWDMLHRKATILTPKNVYASKVIDGESGFYHYTSGSDRYSYAVVPREYDGTALLSIKDRKVEKDGNFRAGKTIQNVLDDESKISRFPGFLFWTGVIIVLAIATKISLIITNKDIEDGEDSGF